MSPWCLSTSKRSLSPNLFIPNILLSVDGTNSNSVTGAGDPDFQCLSFPSSHISSLGCLLVIPTAGPHLRLIRLLRYFYVVSLSPTITLPPWSPWFILPVNLVRFLLWLKFLLMPEDRRTIESLNICGVVVCLPTFLLCWAQAWGAAPTPSHRPEGARSLWTSSFCQLWGVDHLRTGSQSNDLQSVSIYKRKTER